MAFEDFKNERGSEINRIFKENKSILNERRKRASETTQRINAIKREMDMTKEALNFQKSLREKQGKCNVKTPGQWDVGPFAPLGRRRTEIGGEQQGIALFPGSSFDFG